MLFWMTITVAPPGNELGVDMHMGSLKPRQDIACWFVGNCDFLPPDMTLDS